MRIGYDAKRLFNNYTGLGNYSRTIVKNYSELFNKDEFYLYTNKISKNNKTNYFTDSKLFNNITSSNKLSSYWRSYGIINDIKKHKIDIFHGLSNELPMNIDKSGVKSVVTVHDLIFKVYPSTYKYVDRKIYDIKFKSACEKADLVIAISESTKSDIINMYNIPEEKIRVLYQACSDIFYKKTELQLPDKQLPSNYLLYVGSIIERKNLKRVIESYKYIEKDLQIPLVVVGNGKSYKNEVEGLIKKMKLEDRVIFYGNLRDDLQLKRLYQSALALVYPSIYEGFGLPVAEASLCKTPVITSNVSSLPEAGGENTIQVNPESSEEIGNAINKVLSDKSFRNNIIEKSYKYAINKFNPETLSKELHQIYNELMP